MPRREALLRLHESLLTRRSELRKRLGMELADLGHTEQFSAVGDSADAAFDSAGEELSCQLAELEAKELQQIERALKRLKQGVYGQCESCSRKIPAARLNALPYSTLCIKCQLTRGHGHDSLEQAPGGWDKVSDRSVMEERPVNVSDLELGLPK